ncbi:MAG: hypothetical protein QF752_01785 [Planctomycetota bacterium]|nr:hypothetical protein [Planctomycetota bacterium]
MTIAQHISRTIQTPFPIWPPETQIRLTGNSLRIQSSEGLYLLIDLEGRWRSLGLPKYVFRRTVDNYLVISGRNTNPSLTTTVLPRELYRSILCRVQEWIEIAIHRIDSKCIVLVPETSAPEPILNLLERAQQWNSSGFNQEGPQFKSTYHPIGVLPPDRYRNLVLQPSIGCPWNRCKFCTLYKTDPYRVRNRDQFSAHLREVLAFFGKGTRLRKGIFLGQANALGCTQRELTEHLRILRSTFQDEIMYPPQSWNDMAAFFDPRNSPPREDRDYREMYRLGLSTLAIGIETFHPQLLSLLGKGREMEQVEVAINRALNAKIRLRLIFLVGIGDQALAKTHRQTSIRKIEQLPLSRDDIIYLSPLEIREKPYPFPTLSRENTSEEMTRFESTLKRATQARVHRYRVEDFHYYA